MIRIRDEQNPGCSLELLPKGDPEIGSINTDWELRNQNFPASFDLLNQNLHFHKISRDSNMHQNFGSTSLYTSGRILE